MVFSAGGMGDLGDLNPSYEGFAVVTTADPAPSGDIKIHAQPDATSPQVGGADKGEIVGVVPAPDGTTPPAGWAYVKWSGTRNTDGSPARNPASEGYAASAYLVPVAQASPVPSPSDPLPPLPSPIGPSPRPSAQGDNTMLYAGVAVAAVVGLGALAYFMKKKKRK
jgi:hypothetical protein